MPQDHLCNVGVLSLQRTCTAAVAAHCLATRPGGRLSHGAQGSDDIAAVVGAASSAPSAPGRAAHSRCSSDPPSSPVSATPERKAPAQACAAADAPATCAAAAPSEVSETPPAAEPAAMLLMCGSGAAPAAAQCRSASSGSSPRPKSSRGSAIGATAAGAAEPFDGRKAPLPAVPGRPESLQASTLPLAAAPLDGNCGVGPSAPRRRLCPDFAAEADCLS